MAAPEAAEAEAAAAAAATTLSIFSTTYNLFSPKTLTRLKLLLSLIPPISASTLTLTLSPNSPFIPLPFYVHPTTKLRLKLLSTVNEVAVVEEKQDEEEEVEKISQQQSNKRRKLFVHNFPWSFTVVDIGKLFAESGTVTDVEMIKKKDGKNRGYAFVTMASGDETEAVIEKLNSHELVGRPIDLEFSEKIVDESEKKEPIEGKPEE